MKLIYNYILKIQNHIYIFFLILEIFNSIFIFHFFHLEIDLYVCSCKKNIKFEGQSIKRIV